MRIDLDASLTASAGNPVRELGATLSSSRDNSFSAVAGSAPFSDLLADSVAQVSSLEESARTAVTGMMAGGGVDIHQVMIATQKAAMAFELSLSVRNKAIQAYQQVMNLQF